MKYVVLKIDDINKALTSEQQYQLMGIEKSIEKYRKLQGKETKNKYIVVNRDEIYAPVVVEVMHIHGHTISE